jgi:hypothetical protein
MNGARPRLHPLVPVALVTDLAAIVAFAAIGRSSHDEGAGAAMTFEVAAPFLIAAAVGWTIFRLWRSPVSPRRAVWMWATTIVVGMALRRTLFDRGIAVSFIIVATLFLGLLLVGWRAAAGRWVRPPAARR